MDRKVFIERASGLTFTVWISPSLSKWPMAASKMDRIGMGAIAGIPHEWTLAEVPAYYKKRFGVRQLEFRSNHFESLETPYLEMLRGKIRSSESSLVNVQVDTSYDLASADEVERQRSLDHVKKWMDAIAYLGSECVRINPGRGSGSVEKSIESMIEVNGYARSKKLVLLTENHFGIGMNPDIHVRIMPYAYLISAKAMLFNGQMEQLSYDFDRYVQMAEKAGFKGIYSVEQWAPPYQDLDFEKAADWLIDRVKRNI